MYGGVPPAHVAVICTFCPCTAGFGFIDSCDEMNCDCIVDVVLVVVNADVDVDIVEMLDVVGSIVVEPPGYNGGQLFPENWYRACSTISLLSTALAFALLIRTIALALVPIYGPELHPQKCIVAPDAVHVGDAYIETNVPD